MPKNVTIFPPSSQFWQQSAQQVIAMKEPGGMLWQPLESKLPQSDFSALQVIVPAYEHARLLTEALANEFGGVCIPPRINTLPAWLAMQMPDPKSGKPAAASERLMELYAQLREHTWLKNIFAARKDIDLLPLAQTLITLSDELTEAMLPVVLDQGMAQAKQVWEQALASLPAQQTWSDEAQMVWQIWSSQLDGKDVLLSRWRKMLRLIEVVVDPLLWISPVLPNRLERHFLSVYAKKNPTQIISLDWRGAALHGVFATAWPEVLDPTDGRSTAKLNPLTNHISTHISTIGADSLEQEAQYAAQTILDWLQQGKNSIALVAQDRLVARRIRALLERGQVYVADETGWKLSTTRAAAALNAWFDVVATRADTVMLIDLLKSPYFMQTPSMGGGDDKSGWVMEIESTLLRANVVGGWDALCYALQASATLTVIVQLKNAAANYVGRKTIVQWLELTQKTLQEFGVLAGWQQDLAGRQVFQLLEQLYEDCGQLDERFSFSEWRAFIHSQFENTALHTAQHDHRVVMLPLNGARLRRFDAVMMVGCDAAHLPSPPQEVLFFTNTVRRECGLLTREQRQQQQLRDFTELLSSNAEVVLSWQCQQHGEANPMSTWIERLDLCLQRGGLKRLATRGVQLNVQRLSSVRVERPRPIAPILRPMTLSASGYNQLLACPYQFFVQRMLGLSSVDKLSDMPEKSDYGGWLHAILKTYHEALQSHPELYPNEKQEALLRDISNTLFDSVIRNSPVALRYRARWEKVIPAYVDWSQRHSAAGWQFKLGELWLEKKLEWATGEITLRGQIDRIDKNQAGEFAVLDYKAQSIGKLRSKIKEEDQQLPFYGLLAQQQSINCASAHYVALEIDKGMDKGRLADVAANDYAERTEHLQRSIIQHMNAIADGVELPAHGINQVCQFCEVRGLCRKGAW